MSNPIERRLSVNGINMCYFQWGTPSHPTVLLLHATGFHARCWDQVIRSIKTPVNVISVDLRGHGRTDKQGPYDWNTISQDVVCLIDLLELKEILIAGHSMGGRCAVFTERARPDLVKSLVLVDPVILSPELYDDTSSYRDYDSAENHPVASRRDEFESAEAMFNRFKNRHPFALWQPSVLRDYCEYGLERREQTFRLACPPKVEATIYIETAQNPLTELVEQVKSPTVVLRAKERTEPREGLDFSLSPTWPGLADAMVNARDRYLPELTHFIPMQDPALVATEIDSMLD